MHHSFHAAIHYWRDAFYNLSSPTASLSTLCKFKQCNSFVISLLYAAILYLLLILC